MCKQRIDSFGVLMLACLFSLQLTVEGDSSELGNQASRGSLQDRVRKKGKFIINVLWRLLEAKEGHWIRVTLSSHFHLPGGSYTTVVSL